MFVFTARPIDIFCHCLIVLDFVRALNHAIRECQPPPPPYEPEDDDEDFMAALGEDDDGDERNDNNDNEAEEEASRLDPATKGFVPPARTSEDGRMLAALAKAKAIEAEKKKGKRRRRE